MLRFRIGQGWLTVASELDQQLGNRQIGELDHAEFYWTLISGNQRRIAAAGVAAVAAADADAVRMDRRERPRGGGRDAAPAAAVAVAHRSPLRQPAARGGAGHAASCASTWRRSAATCGVAGSWRRCCRPPASTFRCRLAQRRPGIAGRPPAAQASQLAALSGVPVARIAAALAGPADSPHAFTDALRTLRELERVL
jgi:hypothetical protein